MPKQTISIIRHGEKPEVGLDETVLPPLTVTAPGDTGRDDLSPRGWQRAGALVRFLAPRGGDHDDRPIALFAARAGGQFTSLRTQQTIAPLATFLGLAPELPALPDDVEDAAAAILAGGSPALVCWEHRNIAKLVAAITGDESLAPHWSGDRFDVMLVLERSGKGWRLTQVPQMLLADDAKKPLRDRRAKEDR